MVELLTKTQPLKYVEAEETKVGLLVSLQESVSVSTKLPNGLGRVSLISFHSSLILFLLRHGVPVQNNVCDMCINF